MSHATVDPAELPAVPLRVRCGCGVRTIPMWQISDTLTVLRQLLVGRLSPELPIMTHRCRHCKQTSVLTAKDLHLT